MPTDYEKLRSDNMVRYGTDIGRIGPMLLAQRYDNRSHFTFDPGWSELAEPGRQNTGI